MVYNPSMNTQTLPQSNDILAKLLAHENLNIVRGNVRTASFDIRNRVLVLPRWKDMTQSCEQMLILHEVGHALFTSEEKYGVVFQKENVHLRGYANIIEDVRIESRMKERYPGCRKTFTDGYKELRDRDFFDIKNRDLSKMLLIDKINIYYKVGYNSGVTFTSEEHVYVQRVDKCKTESDVLELSKEIYEFSKKQKSESENDISLEEGDDDEYGNEEDDGYGDEYDNMDLADDEEESEKQPPKRSTHGDFKDGVDPEFQPETSESLANKLADSADTNLHFEYFEPEFQYAEQAKDVIIDYQRVLSELKGQIEAKEVISYKNVQEFKASSSSMVNYLIKEFEMKKSATSYKRAKVAKLGQLNLNKLYAYKLKDDIFKQVMVMKEGKKHGMVFLLDWSGSMTNNIAETMEQVINLAMFCQKAQIPFQVFAFTDGYSENYYSHPEYIETNSNGFRTGYNFKLLELFSSKMTNAEFNSMIGVMLNRPWRFRDYGLNGTPLEDAMLYMTSYLGKFKKDFQIEKMSLVTLTDGEGGTLHHSSRHTQDGYSYIDGTKKRIKAILRDNITRKEYPLGDCANTQLVALRSLISDRYDCKCIGFYISSMNINEVRRFYKSNMTHIADKPHLLSTAVHDTHTSLKSNKYKVMENMPGYDEFYILASTKIRETDLSNVNSDMSAAAIARNLTKMFNTRKTSRVVLDKFIVQVS
jgi:hypothetical protein